MLCLAQTVVNFDANEKYFTTKLAGLALGYDGDHLNTAGVVEWIDGSQKSLLPP
jgi:hypothetical protein